MKQEIDFEEEYRRYRQRMGEDNFNIVPFNLFREVQLQAIEREERNKIEKGNAEKGKF